MITRREFLKILGAGTALAALSTVPLCQGCGSETASALKLQQGLQDDYDEDDYDEDDYDDFPGAHSVIDAQAICDISEGDFLYVMPDGYVTNDLPQDQCFPTLGQALEVAKAGSFVIVGM